MKSTIVTILLLAQFAQARNYACSKYDYFSAESKAAALFGIEAIRFLRVKTGFYSKWTGPEDDNLKSACKLAVEAADKAGDGSTIFIGLDSKLYMTLAQYTGSWVSHAGLIFKTNGKWAVIESRAPRGSTETPLCKFIRRSTNYRFAIAKVRRTLTSTEITTLKKSASREAALPYDISFDLSDIKRSFCSKLTYLAYREIGLSFGTPQSLSDTLESIEGSVESRKDAFCFVRSWIYSSRLLRGDLGFDFAQWTISPGSQYQMALSGLNNKSIPFQLSYEYESF